MEKKTTNADELLDDLLRKRKVEEIVTKFLVEKQRRRIEEIQSKTRAAMREKIADKVKEYQAIKKNIEEQDAKRVEAMKNRIVSAGIKKTDDTTEKKLKVVSDEYTDLDEFLDNVMFEEMLNPGL